MAIVSSPFIPTLKFAHFSPPASVQSTSFSRFLRDQVTILSSVSLIFIIEIRLGHAVHIVRDRQLPILLPKGLMATAIPPPNAEVRIYLFTRCDAQFSYKFRISFTSLLSLKLDWLFSIADPSNGSRPCPATRWFIHMWALFYCLAIFMIHFQFLTSSTSEWEMPAADKSLWLHHMEHRWAIRWETLLNLLWNPPFSMINGKYVCSKHRWWAHHHQSRSTAMAATAGIMSRLFLFWFIVLH